MTKLRRTALLAGSCMLGLAAPAGAQSENQSGGVAASQAATRDVEAILADLDALQMPKYDSSRREDGEYVKQYIQDRADYRNGRADLAMELYRADRAHPKAAELMLERWSTLESLKEFEQVLAETKAVEASDASLANDAAYHHALAFGGATDWDIAETMPVIDAFIARAPGDDRGASLLNTAARAAQSTEDQKMLYQRMVDDFPEARTSRFAAGKLRQLSSVGEPFELAFKNAVDGATINVAQQKGTIFVIDFWATWCGPCIAEMPHMKELYAEYKGQGVEFIGISLDLPEDKGGLEKLLAYVKDNEIAWPQFYQGAGWEGEFSKRWGVNAIPCVFVVDAEGNLYSTNARGKLEKMLPELIARREGTN